MTNLSSIVEMLAKQALGNNQVAIPAAFIPARGIGRYSWISIGSYQ
jgi:hypothetical protein